MAKSIIGVLGGGNMGGAIISGIASQYTILLCEQDLAKANLLKKKFKVKVCGLAELLNASNAVIVAVKPQDFDSILGEMAGVITKRTLVISIAAGITASYIEKRLGKGIRVIRTMPNLPAQIKEGITAIAKGKVATAADVKVAEKILGGVGKTVVMDEKWIDAVTAVSGSGPAYVFYFVECFLKAAEKVGFDPKTAQSLVKETLRGSVDLLLSQDEETGVLRQRVTSKGGTTQAALDEFFKADIEATFVKALQAAKKRAGELAK